jgi:hypothetical protein
MKLVGVIPSQVKHLNTNNHLPKPDDYEQKMYHTCCHEWIDLFHTDYHIINIKSEHVALLKKAAQVFAVVPQKNFGIFQDTLTNICLTHDAKYVDATILSHKTFIRADNVSLKYGCHGIVSQNTLQSILESIITCPVGHSPLYQPHVEDKKEKPLQLYVLKWRTIMPRNEFRVFVYQNHITAISQQHLYSQFDYQEEELVKMGEMIVKYFQDEIQNKFEHLGSYVMDVAILYHDSPNNDKPPNVYFIELNPFGAHYSSGSALFHWLDDHHILCATQKNIKMQEQTPEIEIEFRYVLNQ